MKPNPQQASYQDTPELEKARAAFFNEEYSKSLRMFERAVKRQPNNIMALTDAARAFGQRYEIETAAKLVERMLLLCRNNPEVRFLAGQTLRLIHRADEALPHFLAATKGSLPYPDAHLELAVLLERRHRLNEALEQTEKYLSQEPDNPEATLLKARILRRNNQKEDAAAIYHNLANRNGCSHFTKAQTLNEWANMLDSQQDFQGAWDKLRESKSLLAELPETHQAKTRCKQEHAWLTHLTDSLTPDHLQRWMEREPPTSHKSILLTGCPRSGTTLIEKILDAHPEVVSADELGAFTSYILPGLIKGKRDTDGFFDAETLDHLPPVRLKREAQRYLRYLQDALNEKIGDRILVDKNPSVTFIIPAHQRVWPQNRILYALRDPRDVVISCFFRWLPINSMSVRFHTLEDTCKRTIEELDCWHRLRNIMPPGSWQETRYENTIKDFQSESCNLLQWMGLDWDDSIINYRKRLETRGVNSPTYDTVNQPIYKRAAGRWQNYQSQLETHLPHLQEVLTRFNYE